MDPLENKSEGTLRFTVGGRAFQVPVADVERVLSLQRQAISPIPFRLGGRVEGLFRFRGEALPLVRMAGAPSGADGDRGDITVLLLGAGAKRFGVAVDGAGSVCDAADPDAVSVSARSLYEGSAAEV